MWWRESQRRIPSNLNKTLLDPGHARNNATDRRNDECDLSLKDVCTVLEAVVDKWDNGTDLLSRLLAAKGRPEADLAVAYVQAFVASSLKKDVLV
jgi:hypothetical protein